MGLIQAVSQPTSITAPTGYPAEAHTEAGVAVPVNIPESTDYQDVDIKARIHGQRPAINSPDCTLDVIEVNDQWEGKERYEREVSAEEANPYLRALDWQGTCRDGILIAYYTIGQ